MSDVRTSDTRRFEIRTGLTHDDLVAIEEIQREIWGPDDIVPVPHLRAVEHSGGQVAAAFENDRMIGFSYGFLAVPHGRGMAGPGLHSHMVAVRNEGRGLGVGQALKWHQRRWALENDLAWISWTFDPLQARNARLNLEHLGALAFDYLVDFYGAMGGPLGGGQSSDRLLAVWQLGSGRVSRLEPGITKPSDDEALARIGVPASASVTETSSAPQAGRPQAQSISGSVLGPWAVRPSQSTPDAEPLIEAVPDDVETVRVAVPMEVTRLLSENPELARRWRGAVGVTMARLLEHNYIAIGFRDGGYVLKRNIEE